MNEIFKKNVEVLKTHQPTVYARFQKEIEAVEAGINFNEETKENFEWIYNSESKPWNLRYQRADPYFDKSLHAADPLAEAQSVLDSTDLRHPNIVIFLGIGLGHLLKQFLANRPTSNFAIAIIEKNTQFFIRALAVYDFSEELKDRDIQWCIESDLGKVRYFLLGIFVSFATINRYLKVIAHPASLELDPEFYKEVAKSLFSVRDQSTLSIGNSVPDSVRGLENTVSNLDLGIENPGMGAFWDQFQGKVAISVAAGPSLNEHWDTLRSLQGKVPIFACDTLVKPLNDRGIVADFITALERDSIVTDFFRGMPISDRTSLIAPTLLLRDSFLEFKGERLIYCPTSPYTATLGLLHLSILFPGHSAGNLNVAAAAKMGFSTIIMVGHNLAFAPSSGESHVKGTIDPEREKKKTPEELVAIYGNFRVKSQCGDLDLQTRYEYNLFRQEIENTISAHDKIKFVNTALEGAKIEGAEAMTFKEALARYVKEDFDILPTKRKLVKAVTQKEKFARAERSVANCKRAVEVGERYLEECEQMLKSFEKWRTEIEETEKRGEKVPFEMMDQALDQALDLKVRGINEDPFFNTTYVSVMSPAHVTFERVINEMPGYYKSNYELKRDFLLKHEQYFQIWNMYIPEMLEQYRKALALGEELVKRLKPKRIQKLLDLFARSD